MCIHVSHTYAYVFRIVYTFSIYIVPIYYLLTFLFIILASLCNDMEPVTLQPRRLWVSTFGTRGHSSSFWTATVGASWTSKSLGSRGLRSWYKVDLGLMQCVVCQ